jgi:DNA-binding NarL/FixJ family response regulator
MTRVRVLVADDDDAFRELVRLRLQLRDGVTVVADARDGGEAVQQAVAHRPDVVLLDIDMPRVDGFAAAAAIRVAVPEAAVFLHTGEYTSANLERAAGLGIVVLDKMRLDVTVAQLESAAADDDVPIAERLKLIRANLARLRTDGRAEIDRITAAHAATADDAAAPPAHPTSS